MLQEVGEVQQIAGRLVMPVGALDVLKVIPLNFHLGVVVVRAQVHAANAGDVDLVQDRVVGLDRKLFVISTARIFPDGKAGRIPSR
jgi:hypothetical protein